jgi:prepilin-type N-terminal cleavage/methylation domain-containing protein
MCKRGFTLIELLVVIAVVGILATIAVTSYVGVQKKAARSEAYSNLESLRLLEEQVFAENAVYFPDPARGHANPTVGAANIQAIMPGFRPGGNPTAPPDFGLSFIYQIQQNVQITAINPLATEASPNPCFVATATGVAGTRVAGDVFAIDCNNNRNF